MISRRTILKLIGLAPVVAPVAAVAAMGATGEYFPRRPADHVYLEWEPTPGATGYWGFLTKAGSVRAEDTVFFKTSRHVLTASDVQIDVGALYHAEVYGEFPANRYGFTLPSRHGIPA